MPAPSVATYSVAAKVAANTSFRDLIDSGAGPGLFRVRSAADVLLAEATLNDPCGSVDGGTGVLTINVTGVSDASANATGTAAYGEFCDSTGAVHLALPAQAGTAAVAGKVVINILSVVAGLPVFLLGASID